MSHSRYPLPDGRTMIAIVDGRCEQCRARIKPGDLLTSIDDQWCWTDCATKAGFNPDKRERGGP